MAKLHFKYGALNSSKTANLLMTAHNYEENGRVVWLFQPNINIRNNVNKISSRIGIEKNCFVFKKESNLVNLVNNLSEYLDEFPSVILIDEIQFATSKHIRELIELVDEYDITIITYGLKSSYKGELFDSIKELIVYADKVEEIKQICSMCNSKAFMNLKIVSNEAIYSGETISIGDVVSGANKEREDIFYTPVCRKHYFKPILENL